MNKINLTQLRTRVELYVTDVVEKDTLLALIEVVELLATTEDVHWRPEIRDALDRFDFD